LAHRRPPGCARGWLARHNETIAATMKMFKDAIRRRRAAAAAAAREEEEGTDAESVTGQGPRI
jgi:hypothetical protein